MSLMHSFLCLIINPGKGEFYSNMIRLVRVTTSEKYENNEYYSAEVHAYSSLLILQKIYYPTSDYTFGTLIPC